MVDRFDYQEDVRSVESWQYYNNGENPDTLEYKTKMWNTNVYINGERRFHGDLSKERIQFLVNITKKYRKTVLLTNEYEIPQILITMGRMYSLFFKMDIVLSNHLLDKKDEVVDLKSLDSCELSNQIINYHGQV